MLRIVFFIAVLVAIGCSDSPNNSAIPAGNEPSLLTRCGVIFDGQLLNPISEDSGLEVYGASLIDTNVYRVTLDRRTELVYLHGTMKNLGEGALDNLNGPTRQLQTTLEDVLSNETRLFFPYNSKSCKVSTPYGDALLGNIVSTSGQSLSEELLEKGELSPAVSGDCGEALLTKCYQGIVED